MKKLLVLTLLFGLVGCGTQEKKEVGLHVVHEHIVLKQKEKEGHTTIIASVQDNDNDNDGYIIVKNLYDKNDNVAIEKENYKKGDILLITFNGDLVSLVKKNNLNIGGKQL